MEAPMARAAGRWIGLAVALVVSLGASHRGKNFVVEAPGAELASRISSAAETFRKDLAVSWLGRALPDWSAPCVMTVRVGPHLGAGGATTFLFEQGEVYGWRMSIQGSEERIFDSVLPHEITHMVFASHFRQPLPRWADEGAATSVEHPSERQKHQAMLRQFLTSGRGIAFNRMFALREYPSDVMPLYAQGYSLAEFLIQRGGRRRFVAYLGDGLASGNWSEATARHYGIGDLGQLQNTWLAWVRDGYPALAPRGQEPEPSRSGELIAAALGKRPRPEPNLVYHEPPVAASPRRRLVPIEPAMPVVPVVQSELARPQPVEPARQIILEWQKQ